MDDGARARDFCAVAEHTTRSSGQKGGAKMALLAVVERNWRVARIIVVAVVVAVVLALSGRWQLQAATSSLQQAHHQDNPLRVAGTRGKSLGTPDAFETFSCRTPYVAWDTPLEGGSLTGISDEAVSWLLSVSENATLFLPNLFRDASSFVASLPTSAQQELWGLRNETMEMRRRWRYARNRGLQGRQAEHSSSLPDSHPCVYVSQWQLGSLYTSHLAAYLALIGDAMCDPSRVYRVGRTMYEATRMPIEWEASFAEVDEFWVPSEWNRQVLIKEHGIPAEDVFVVEQGLDPRRIFNPSLYNKEAARQQVYHDAAQDAFIFLSVFKWEERKAPYDLIRAFVKAFPRNSTQFGELHHTTSGSGKGHHEGKDVLLYLRTSLPHGRDIQTVVQRATGASDPRIRVLPPQMGENYQNAFAGADAFVLASHGEGWGRPIVEALAMGLPTIATDWSGPSQYLNNDAAFPLAVDSLEPAVYDGLRSDSAQWAMIDVTQLARRMQEVVRLPEEAARRGRNAVMHVRQHFDQNVLAERVVDRLRVACERQRMGIFPRKKR